MNQTFQTLRQNFSPLLIRNFRIYLGGQAISLVGTWLQMTAQGIVVYQLSNGAATPLGIVGMLGTLPILLLGPWTGVWADRLDRRWLLIGTQVAAMLLAVVLALLTQTGLVQLWHVYILATLLGIVTALDMPTQQAFLGDLAGMAEVRKAVNLNAIIVNVSRMLGPALAGYIIGALGAALAFWFNGLSFVAVVVSLLMVRTHQVRSSREGQAGGNFGEAIEFIRSQPRIQDLIIFVILITFFGLAVINIMPAVARGSPENTGLLLAASGLGALVSAVLIVPLAQAARRIGIVVGNAVLWMGAWFVTLSLTTWLPLQVASMFFISLGAPIVFTMALGLLQILAPPAMRARLLSIFTMVSFGLQPLASLLIGHNADVLGTSLAIGINGTLLFAGGALMLALRSGLRSWEMAATPQPVRATEP